MARTAWIWSREAVFASDLTKGREVVDELLVRLQDAGWSREEIFAVHLAAEEAMTNAVKHGNRNDLSKKVRVRLRLADDRVQITIWDEGHGFDPRRVPDPTAPENLDRPCGRGVLLIREFMSRVHYNPQGNRIIMERDRSTPVRRTED